MIFDVIALGLSILFLFFFSIGILLFVLGCATRDIVVNAYKWLSQELYSDKPSKAIE